MFKMIHISQEFMGLFILYELALHWLTVFAHHSMESRKKLFLTMNRKKFANSEEVSGRALVIVDPQIDFICGSLAVPGAEQAMDKLADWLLKNPERYALKIVSQDWHCADHSSFNENGGSWPVHCVAQSQGSEVWPALQKALQNTAGELLYIKKAQNKEEYSLLQNEDNKSQLKENIEKYGISKIDICGIAGDICVLATLKDMLQIYEPEMLEVLEKFSPSLDKGTALKHFIREKL